METTRGGKRIGAGRKKGLASIKSEEARNYAVKRITEELGPILTGQIELAKGVFFESEDENGIRIVYQKPPNAQVASYLISQVIGRPKETTELKIEQTFSLRELGRQADEIRKLEAEKTGAKSVRYIEA